MNFMRASLLSGGLAATLLIMQSCAVNGVEGGVGYGGDLGYEGGYYEPYGYDYGGWGAAYRVGPERCCGHRDEHHDHPAHPGHAAHGHAYRPAPRGRPTPSIPGRSRSH